MAKIASYDSWQTQMHTDCVLMEKDVKQKLWTFKKQLILPCTEKRTKNDHICCYNFW